MSGSRMSFSTKMFAALIQPKWPMIRPPASTIGSGRGNLPSEGRTSELHASSQAGAYLAKFKDSRQIAADHSIRRRCICKPPPCVRMPTRRTFGRRTFLAW